MSDVPTPLSDTHIPACQGLQERSEQQQAPLDDGHMSLGRTGAGGQKRVGLRSSMSRLVLLAARESQDTELDMADGGTGKTLTRSVRGGGRADVEVRAGSGVTAADRRDTGGDLRLTVAVSDLPI